MTITPSSLKASQKELWVWALSQPWRDMPGAGTGKALTAGPWGLVGSSKGTTVNLISPCRPLATMKCVNICEFSKPFQLPG